MEGGKGKSGIIETLSAGFATVNRQLALLLIPLGVDVILWLGPRLSPAPLAEQFLRWYQRNLTQSPFPGLPPASPLPPGQLYDHSQEMLAPIANFNLLRILGWQVPNLMNALPKVASPLESPVRTIESWGSLWLLVAGLAALGLLLACLYFGAVAQYVRGPRFSPLFYLSRLSTNWLRWAAFFLAILLVMVFLGPPVFLIISALSLINAALGSLAVTLLLGLAFAFLFYSFFIPGAIFVGDVNAFRGLGQSFHLVRHHFWPALGLFLLANVILWGTPVAWGVIARHPLGAAVAILGNAYIATGLAAAAMIFYRDRSPVAEPVPAGPPPAPPKEKEDEQPK